MNFNWRFCGYFLLYLSLFLFLVLIPLSFLQSFKTFTASAVTFFWKALVPLANSDTRISFIGFPMEITLECTALHYLIVLFAGILACQSHSFFYKTAGLFMGAVSIFFLNILRIGIIGMVGHYSGSLFDFVHLYLWQGTFALVVLLLWILWANGKSGISRAFTRYVFFSFIVASISFWCMIKCLNYYASLLAFTANALISSIPGVIGIKFGSFAEGNVIGYASQNGVIYNNISIDVMNSVLFFTLAIVKSSFAQRSVFIKRTLLGTLLLCLQHLLYVVMYGIILVNGMDAEKFSVLIWFTRGFSIATPLLIWLFVTTLLHSDDKQCLRHHG